MKAIAIATAILMATTAAHAETGGANLLTVSFDFGKRDASITESRLNFGGVVGKTGAALQAAFDNPHRLHAKTAKEKQSAVLWGLAAAGLLVWAINEDDDDDCVQVLAKDEGGRGPAVYHCE